MTAFNVVRFRVKAGEETAFVEGHRRLTAQARKNLKGLKSVNLVRTGDSTFCFVGEWRTFKSIANAREHMIGMLDQFRPMLEDLGGGLGLTDPVSGESVLQIKGAAAKAKASSVKPKAKKKAKRKRAR